MSRDTKRDHVPASGAETGQDQDLDSPTDLPKESLKDVLKRARVEFRNDHLTDLAAGLTYYAVLSVVPALIVLVSLLGLMGPDATKQVVEQANAIAPGSSAELIQTFIQQAQANQRGAGFGAILGLAVALWSASGYVAAFMRASNVVYDIGEGRPIWKTIPLRIGLTVFALVILLIGVLIVVLSGPVAQQIGDLLGLGETTVLVWNIVKWPVLVVLISVLLAVLFWAAPNAKQQGIKWVSPGGVIAVLIWLGASALFALYVTLFASYNKTYGSLAGVVIFLVWLWLTNIAVLLGMEINAELQHGRAIAEGLPPEVEPFAEPRDTRKMDEGETRDVAEAERERQS
ncbi:MAG TPA: YihY/virulence factor BrkB family protein [Lapillicoccus sp.]|nr:YihY/virulence factor BrkB family protein [Lapillicoccus sp.]